MAEIECRTEDFQLKYVIFAALTKALLITHQIIYEMILYGNKDWCNSIQSIRYLFRMESLKFSFII